MKRTDPTPLNYHCHLRLFINGKWHDKIRTGWKKDLDRLIARLTKRKVKFKVMLLEPSFYA